MIGLNKQNLKFKIMNKFDLKFNLLVEYTKIFPKDGTDYIIDRVDTLIILNEAYIDLYLKKYGNTIESIKTITEKILIQEKQLNNLIV